MNVKGKMLLMRYGVMVLLVLGIFAVYGQVSNHEFVSVDDHAYVTENPYVLAGIDFQAMSWIWTHPHDGNYIPLTWLSHMLDVQLFGLDSGRHHLVNVVIHLGTTLLLLWVLFGMTHCFWRSIFVAALFALHPLHAESVAWVAERKDVLSAFLGMLTCFAYYQYGRKQGVLRYFTVLFFYVIGLLAKPMVITLPFVFLLLDYWPLGRSKNKGAWRNLVREKIPFGVIAGIFSVLTFYTQYERGWVNPIEVLPVNVRLANAALSYVTYLFKTFWPVDLALFYPYESPVWLLLLKGMLSFCLLVGVTLWILKRQKQYPYLLTGWMWYLVMLLPVSGIVALGGYSMTDRYTYLPIVGIFIMGVWGVSEFVLNQTRWKTGVSIGSCFILTVLAFLTWRQVGYWRDTPTLFKHALEVTERNYLAHEGLATYYSGQKQLGLAAYHLERAVSINPHPHMLNNLGSTYYLLGRTDDAIHIYQKTVERDPSMAVSWYNLGLMHQQKEMFEEAGAYYVETLRQQPDYLPAHLGLADSLIHQQRYLEAHYLLQRVHKTWPESEAVRQRIRNLDGKVPGFVESHIDE